MKALFVALCVISLPALASASEGNFGLGLNNGEDAQDGGLVVEQPATGEEAPLAPEAGYAPRENRQQRGRLSLECMSTNRAGQRFVARSVDQQGAMEEALYDCYVANEAVARSCRVVACRQPGSFWKRIQ